eukprot:c12494_g2_i4.p1 GENE.c12494_g2_i4~~c12494_g2_i4.p1  ORF type:complete len:179 (+),score=27.77 c12494_g2_i4:2-538(+)
MQIIHNHGYTEEERQALVPTIRNHITESFRDLILGGSFLGVIPAEVEQQANELLDKIEHEGLNGYVPQIMSMWKGEHLQAAFQHHQKFQLTDSAQYFFDKLDTITQPSYVPSHEDVLMCRVRTTGVHEIQFVADGVKFRMVDVGGQRNERRKWIHCFDDVQGVRIKPQHLSTIIHNYT